MQPGSLLALAWVLAITIPAAAAVAADYGAQPVNRAVVASQANPWNALETGKSETPGTAVATPAPSPTPATAARPAATPPPAAPAIPPTSPNIGEKPAATLTKPSEFDKTVIRREGPSADSAAATAATPSGEGASDIVRIVTALGIVLGLIFFLRWGSRKLFAMPAARGSSRAIQIVTRSVMSPKQQLVLVRVGRRLVLIGDSGTQMNPLCEITDPDEIAAIHGQLNTNRDSSAGNPFGSLFSRLKRRFDATAGDSDEQAIADAGGNDPSGLASAGISLALDGVDGIGSAGPASRSDGGDSEVGLSEAAVNDAVSAAQQELSGLRERLRLVSRQFGREA